MRCNFDATNYCETDTSVLCYFLVFNIAYFHGSFKKVSIYGNATFANNRSQ